MAFEKGSVLFNIAALQSQLGAREERTTRRGLDAAIEHYLKAAGVYRSGHITRVADISGQVISLEQRVGTDRVLGLQRWASIGWFECSGHMLVFIFMG